MRSYCLVPLWALCWVLLIGCQSAQSSKTPPDLRLNEIQFVGSHNSYKQAIDPALLRQIAEANPSLAASLEYEHIPLAQQLDLGLRNLELDLYYDPSGARYANPLGLRIIADSKDYDPEALMQAPGFKVLHVQDLDFRSSCLTLVRCLEQLKQWSEAHPQHSPIVVTVNAKDDAIDRPGFTQPLPFNAQAWRELDDALETGMGTHLFVPDELRGRHATLMRAIQSEGWPAVRDMQGKFLFVLDEPPGKLSGYIEGHQALERRVMFVNAPVGAAESAIRIINDPKRSFDEIRDMVRAGYIVRTRADADTIEARNNDTSRREAAFASGAQIITTDYYLPAAGFATDYQVTLPDSASSTSAWRCNPVSVSACQGNQ